MSFTLGLLKLFLLLKLHLGLILLLDQSLELTRQIPSELKGLEHLLVLGDGQLLVSVQLLASLAVGSVAIKLGLEIGKVQVNTSIGNEASLFQLNLCKRENLIGIRMPNYERNNEFQ